MLARWHVEPVALVVVAVVAMLYARGRRASRDAARPGETATFVGGLAVVVLAIVSPVATYAETLLSVHMVQHLLLVLVAAPAIVAARPLGPILAALPEGLAAALRRVGKGPIGRLTVHPLVAWVLFALAGWAVHFSPLFNLALEHPPLHAAEHALFLGSGLLFWAPVVGGSALSYPMRLLYVALAMPQNTFLALAISSAGEPLYEAYGRLGRTWGPSLLADQRQAGGLMWVAGDVALLVAVLAVAAAWGSHETREEDGEPMPTPSPGGGF